MKIGNGNHRGLWLWLLLSLLAGCGAPPVTESPTDQAPSGGLVILWHPFTDARRDALQALGDQFNAQQPAGLTLIVEYHTDMTTRLPTTPAAQRPDLVIASPQEAQLYGARGLAPLPPELIPADLLPMGQALFTVEGALQALPLGLATYVLYTNDNWLRDIGYTPSTAILEDLRLSACRATDLASGQVGLGLPSQPGVLLALLAAGNSALIGDTGRYHFDDPAGVRLGAAIKEALRAACARTFAIPADGISQFSDSAMAMLIESSLKHREVEAAVAAESNFTLGLAPLPGPTGPGASLWYGIGVLLTAPEGPRRDAAQIVLEWLLLPETQATWTTMTQYLPARASGVEAQLAALPFAAAAERELLRMTLHAASSGAWVAWPAQARDQDCRIGLVHALTSLNSEQPAHEILRLAAETCNAELLP